MNSDTLREVPGMCGVVDGGITAGLWGYEAGQSGVGDIFGWFVTTQVPHAYAAESRRARHLRPRAAHREGRHPGDRRARPRRPRLAPRQPFGPGQPRAVGPRPGPDPGHPPRRHLPRAARVDGVRDPDDRGDLPVLRHPGHRAGRRRGVAQERAADADLRRRARPPAVDHRLGPGSGPRLGDPCRRRRRRLSRRRHGRPRHGPCQPRRLPARAEPTSRRTTSCTPSTARSTTTSAGAGAT